MVKKIPHMTGYDPNHVRYCIIVAAVTLTLSPFVPFLLSCFRFNHTPVSTDLGIRTRIFVENTREPGFNQKFCYIISQPYAGSGFTVESRFRLEGFLSILFPGNPFNLRSQDSVMIQFFKCADIVSCFLCLVNFFENGIVPQIPDLSEQTVHCHSVSGLRCRHSRSLR